MLAVFVLINPAVFMHAHAFELFGRCIYGECENAEAKADAELIQ